MEFQLSEEQLMIQQAARDFAVNECLPGVIERDDLQKFPKEQIEKLADLGFMGMMVKPEYGGSGMGYQEYSVIIQEISKVCGSIGLSLAAHNSLCTGHILAFASEEQKKEYLPKLATAEHIGAWGLRDGKGKTPSRATPTIALDSHAAATISFGKAFLAVSLREDGHLGGPPPKRISCAARRPRAAFCRPVL